MSERPPLLPSARVAETDEPPGSGPKEVDASASTVASAESDTLAPRSPSGQALHDEVKARLFEGKPAPPEVYEAGTLLAGRYRVSALLGRGGMGEVYRAHDLVLEEDVAIKFLPRDLAHSEVYLARFLAEVRTARQVSHANVCRVHDIAEADGRRFLSMEYIDGEDLQSLLRRIGRLPQEKAIELAHQLCRGLHALHERGILHRDLKPSNVMLDGRGRVRIADFGLASHAERIGEHELRDGTPAYMAPEQARGESVSVRSDVYALGLVLFELFTGRHALDAGRDRTSPAGSRPATASDLVADIDPAVERAIGRCLDPDPEARPASALAVAAALPGGDPIAAALAAGETPTPEVLAAAGRAQALRPALGWAYLAMTAFVLAVVAWLATTTTTLGLGVPPLPPDVLEHRAREAIAAAGHDTPAVDRYAQLRWDFEYLQWLESDALQRIPGAALAADGVPAIVLDYRQHPGPLVAIGSAVSMGDPPLLEEGAVRVQVDGRGRLRRLTIVPPDRIDVAASPLAPDFGPLLEHAGFDALRLRPAEPRHVPPVWADHRVAWTAELPERPEIQVRIEAAAAGGQPVSFRVFPPWSAHFEAEAVAPVAPASSEAAEILGLGLLIVVLVGAALLARRTLARGESDRLGAARVGILVAGVMVVGRFTMGHVPTGSGWLPALGTAARDGAAFGLLAWLGYVVVEPHARRVWPRTMISWVRLLRGQAGDPAVGAEILAGTAMGGVFVVLARARDILAAQPGEPVSTWTSLQGLSGFVPSIGVLHVAAVDAFLAILSVYVLMLLYRLVLRRDWAAIAAFVVLRTAIIGLASPEPIGIVFAAVESTLFAFIVVRLGLLGTFVAQFVAFVYIFYPWSADFGPWWSSSGLVVPLVVGGLALYGHRRATTVAG